MTVQDFRELLTQRPFTPFRLVMSSGQTYDVRHPEMAMLTRHGSNASLDKMQRQPRGISRRLKCHQP